MIASKRSSLGVRTTSDRFGQVVGPRKHGAVSPTAYGSLAAWYDVSLPASTTSSDVRIDSSNRVSLVADKSGNSAANCLCLPGTSGNYASAPDSAALSITGDIDIRLFMGMPDWTPSAPMTPIAKYGIAGTRSYVLEMRTDGKPEFTWSTDGTANITKTATVAPTVTDHSSLWLRVTLDVDDGAGNNVVRYYTSTDGITWTLLGNAITTVGTTSIYDGTSLLNIGSYSNGTNSLFNGRFYRVQIRNNILDDGTGIVFDANFSLPAKLATSFTESSSNAATVTINSSGDLGARISGERDLVQLTAAKQPIYLQHSGTNYGYVNGTSGTYFSTPDSSGLDVVGDLDLRCKVAMDDWTPSGDATFVAKWVGGAASYVFQVDSAGKLLLAWSEDGTVSKSAKSTVAPTIADRATLWVRGTLDVDNGASGNTVTFYTSTDGTNWTQLGTPVVTAGVTSIYNSNSVGSVGALNNGAGSRLAGIIYRAQVLNGIGGTVVADFDPSRYSSGTTFTASTGEVWTLNGGSTIVTRTCLYFDGSDDYMRSALYSINSFGVNTTGYLVAGQVSWTDIRALLDLSDNSATGQMQLRQNTSTPNLGFLPAGGVQANNNGLALQTGGVVSFGTGTAGAATFLRVNRGASAAGTHANVNIGALCLGARWATSSADRNGNLAFSGFAIYSAAHDTATQFRLVQYFGNKWGISV